MFRFAVNKRWKTIFFTVHTLFVPLRLLFILVLLLNILLHWRLLVVPVNYKGVAGGGLWWKPRRCCNSTVKVKNTTRLVSHLRGKTRSGNVPIFSHPFPGWIHGHVPWIHLPMATFLWISWDRKKTSTRGRRWQIRPRKRCGKSRPQAKTILERKACRGLP